MDPFTYFESLFTSYTISGLEKDKYWRLPTCILFLRIKQVLPDVRSAWETRHQCVYLFGIYLTRWLSPHASVGLVDFLCHLVISACYIQFASLRHILFYNFHVLARSYYLHVLYLCFVRFLVFVIPFHILMAHI